MVTDYSLSKSFEQKFSFTKSFFLFLSVTHVTLIAVNVFSLTHWRGRPPPNSLDHLCGDQDDKRHQQNQARNDVSHTRQASQVHQGGEHRVKNQSTDDQRCVPHHSNKTKYFSYFILIHILKKQKIDKLQIIIFLSVF